MIQNCEAMKVGRLIFDGRLRQSFDERKFLEAFMGWDGKCTLEESARSWVASSEDDEATFISNFGEDEYQIHQGFMGGVAEVLCSLAWSTIGVEIPQRNTSWPAEPKPRGIDLFPVAVASPIFFELDTFDPPTPTEFRAVIERLGLTKVAAAAKIGANERHIRRWCSERYESGRKAISREQWATLQEAANAAPQPSEQLAPPPPAGMSPSARAFSSSEQDAINAALTAGRAQKIERGTWPGSERLNKRWRG